MRKQKVFIVLFLGSVITTDIHAILEISTLFSMAALNATATCFLCCMRCNDKSQWDDRLNAVETSSKQNTKNILELVEDLHKVRDQSYDTARQLYLINAIATGKLINPTSSMSKLHIQRPRSVLEEFHEPNSPVTNTGLSLIPSSPRPMRLLLGSRPSLKMPPTEPSLQLSPTDCQ
jgi:hypothetical protein